ncbi:MAG: dihydropteroate synthase [Myxococcota bacterium]|jgi:dihydropteroate synthase
MSAAPLVVGIVNVTPDSFYDGGRYPSPIAHAERLIAEGADWLDVGGESTRPGAAVVSVEEECRRVLPIISAFAGSIPISIDTTKPAVARAAAAAGATILNDVSGLCDPEMIAVSADFAAVVIMHSRGTPQRIGSGTTYGALGCTDYIDLVTEVTDFLLERAEAARADAVYIDPGIGFGKSAAQSLALLRHLPRIVAAGLPVLVGASRKSFIGQTLGISDPADRLPGSLAVAASAYHHGAAALRVHDVAATRQVVDLLTAIHSAP